MQTDDRKTIRGLLVLSLMLMTISCGKPLISTQELSDPESGRVESVPVSTVFLGSAANTDEVTGYAAAPDLQVTHLRKHRNGMTRIQKHKVVQTERKLGEDKDSQLQEQDVLSSADRKTYTNEMAWWAGAGGLLSIAGLLFARQKTKQLAYWASRNPWKARLIIAGTQLATSVGAFFTGAQMEASGLGFTEALYPAAASTFILAALLYPDAFLGLPFLERSFLHAKIHDAMLFTTGTAMMMCVGNQSVPDKAFSRVVLDKIPVESFQIRAERLDDLGYRYLVPTTTPPQDPPTRKGKGWWVLLAVLVFAGLSFLLLSLACSISCAGAEGLAALVGIGGGFGLVALLVATIQGIYGKKRKMKRTPVPVDPGGALTPG